MIDAALSALSEVFTLQGILAVVIGAGVVGLLFGLLPGFGALNAMALMLPFAFLLPQDIGILFMIAIMSSVSFSGSITAILLNTPGAPQNIVTTLDGHPMAISGRAKYALYVSALSSLFGTVMSALFFWALIPFMRVIAMAFRTPDIFWLVAIGIVMISIASRGNMLKGIAAGALGILLALVGYVYVFTELRFTAGTMFLYDGIPLIPLGIGLFALVPSVIYGARATIIDEDSARAARASGKTQTQAREAFRDFYANKWVALRSGFIGIFMGIVPAIGGSTASFVSYTVGKMFSKKSSMFGQGAVDGLISSETANDAKDGGALFPTAAFGIPGDGATAILLAAMMLYGISVGPKLVTTHLDILLILVFGMIFGQLVVSILGLAAASQLAKVTTVKTYYIVPVVMAVAFIGTYLSGTMVWHILFTLFGLMISYGLIRHGYPGISFLIGFLLGEQFEQSFVMSLKMAQGDYGIFLQTGISKALIILIIGIFITVFLMGRSRKSKKSSSAVHRMADGGQKRSEEPENGSSVDNANKVPAVFKRKWSGVIFALFLIAFAGVFFVGSFSYAADARLFPMILSGLIIFVCLLSVGSGISARIHGFLSHFESDLADSTTTGGEGSKTLALCSPYRIIAWIMAFGISLILFGFYISIPLFIFGYIMSFNSRKWLLAASIAMITFLAIFGLSFVDFVPKLWPGAIPELIRGYLGGGIIPTFFR